MISRCLFVLVLMSLAQLHAQDSLELSDGRRLRGEILSEQDGLIRFVTRDAELLEIDAKLVTERKEGRGLDSALVERLAGAEEDIDQLLAAAEWAAEKRSLARDVERIHRRVVALDPEEPKARAALGHIKLGGVWYLDEKEGRRAWGKILADQGYVAYKTGFVLKTSLADLRRGDSKFIMDEELRWRPIAEIMAERGMAAFNGEWYHAINDGLVLDELKALKEALGIEAQGYRHRGNEVYIVGDRFAAEKLAKKLNDARWWIRRNFNQREDAFLDDPRAQFFCLANRAQYHQFLKSYGRKHGRDADKVRFCMDLTGMSFNRLSRVTDQEQVGWDNSLVSGLVAASIRYLAPEEVVIPAGLWVGASMLAEETVMGSVKIHFVAASKYDQADGPDSSFENFGEAQKDLLELKIRRKTRPMAELLRVDVNGLLPAHELQGYFFMKFLLEKKKDAILGFWMEPGQAGETLEARFHRFLGAGMSELETEFWGWFERLPR